MGDRLSDGLEDGIYRCYKCGERTPAVDFILGADMCRYCYDTLNDDWSGLDDEETEIDLSRDIEDDDSNDPNDSRNI